jgi:hypothetical protein
MAVKKLGHKRRTKLCDRCLLRLRCLAKLPSYRKKARPRRSVNEVVREAVERTALWTKGSDSKWPVFTKSTSGPRRMGKNR